MSNGLAEQIAVLDGLDGLEAMDPNDGRIGQTQAQVDQYGRPIMRGVLSRKMVLDASEGANYSGGSAYAPGLPLMPSTVGLAGVPTIQGGYGSAGLGGSLIQGGYGSAGLGVTGSYVDEDLAAASDTVTAIRDGVPVQQSSMVSPSAADGRIGQVAAQVDQYGRPIMRGVLSRKMVLDASEGANYSGGSSYAAGLPLMPSTVGLAGFANIPSVLPPKTNVIDPSGGANYTGGSDWAPGMPLLVSSAGLAGLGELDELDLWDDEMVFSGLEGRFGRRLASRFKKAAGKARIKQIKSMARQAVRKFERLSPAQQAMQRTRVGRRLKTMARKLNVARAIRRRAVQAARMPVPATRMPVPATRAQPVKREAKKIGAALLARQVVPENRRQFLSLPMHAASRSSWRRFA